MATVAKAQRVVKGTVDGQGIYCSRLATAGHLVFMAGTAVDDSGRLADAARVKAPYHSSPSAQVRAQTEFIFNRFKEGLAELGSSVDDILQVEQYIQRKIHADGYLVTSRGPGLMERRRPASALIATGDLLPQGCVVNPTGIAVIPSGDVAKEILLPEEERVGEHAELGGAYVEPPYNDIVTAGAYVFTVGDFALEYGIGIHPDVKAPDWIWWGNEIRNEAQFNLDVLQGLLGRAGTTLDNAVRCTVYVTDLEDLYELDLVWQRYFPKNPPARTTIPVAGMGTPRRENVRGHQQGAMKYESMFQSIRPGFGAEKEVVSTGAEPLSHESEAIRAGSLLWISGQLAGGPDGLLSAPDTPSQLDHVFGRLDEICRAGGTSLANLVQVRAFLTDAGDGYAVYAALKDAVPSDPPSVVVSSVPAPLQVPGCSVVVDAVACVP